MRGCGASPASIKKAMEGYYLYRKLLHHVPVTQEELKKITEAVIPSASIPKLEVPGQLLSEVEARQINWLWPGRIPLGKITILDGDPGMGKSLITVDLAARVSTGQPMPDGTPGQQGSVLLVAPPKMTHTIPSNLAWKLQAAIQRGYYCCIPEKVLTAIKCRSTIVLSPSHRTLML